MMMQLLKPMVMVKTKRRRKRRSKCHLERSRASLMRTLAVSKSTSSVRTVKCAKENNLNITGIWRGV